MMISNNQIILLAVIIIAAAVGIVSVKYLGPNNAVERIAEEVIKEETGVSVDLTIPTTSEAPVAPSSSSSGNMPAAQPIQTQSSEKQITPPSTPLS